MLKQGWSWAIHCNTSGLFYFILNISIPPVLLGNGRIQTPAGSMEQPREGSNSSCSSQKQNDAVRGLCFISKGFCRVGIWQQRWARSTCTCGGRHLAAVGGWALDQTPPSASRADGRGREARAFLPRPCVLSHTVKTKLFQWTVSVLWCLRRYYNEMGAMYFMREREEGNEIRIALPTITHLFPPPPSGWTFLALIPRNQHLLHICMSEIGHKPWVRI